MWTLGRRVSRSPAKRSNTKPAAAVPLSESWCSFWVEKLPPPKNEYGTPKMERWLVGSDVFHIVIPFLMHFGFHVKCRGSNNHMQPKKTKSQANLWHGFSFHRCFFVFCWYLWYLFSPLRNLLRSAKLGLWMVLCWTPATWAWEFSWGIFVDL